MESQQVALATRCNFAAQTLAPCQSHVSLRIGIRCSSSRYRRVSNFSLSCPSHFSPSIRLMLLFTGADVGSGSCNLFCLWFSQFFSLILLSRSSALAGFPLHLATLFTHISISLPLVFIFLRLPFLPLARCNCTSVQEHRIAWYKMYLCGGIKHQAFYSIGCALVTINF